jgi:hypothetical protein
MPSFDFPLSRGERLLWTGRPRQGLLLRGSDAFAIPFSLFWGGFALFWNASVWRMGAPWFFRLFGLPFLVMGLYVTVGRFWWEARVRARTAYALTSERIIIASGGLRPTLKSLGLQTLSDVSVTERRDGSGTILLGPTPSGTMMMFGSRSWPNGAQVPSFELIPDAKRVFDAIHEARRAALRPGSDEAEAPPLNRW